MAGHWPTGWPNPPKFASNYAWVEPFPCSHGDGVPGYPPCAGVGASEGPGGADVVIVSRVRMLGLGSPDRALVLAFEVFLRVLGRKDGNLALGRY